MYTFLLIVARKGSAIKAESTDRKHFFDRKDFFVGQIEKKLANKVWVTFLEQKKDAFFSWLKRKDRADIKLAFIFCRNLEVLQEKDNYIVKHLTELRQKFEGFSS